MKTTGKLIDVIHGFLSRKTIITLEIENDVAAELEKLQKEDVLSAEIKKYRGKRSLDANAYYWTLIAKLAKALGNSNTMQHNLMLRDYGQIRIIDGSTVKVRIPDTEEAENAALRSEEYHIKPDDGDIEIDEEGNQYRYYFLLRGSSTYNTDEMSRLINGVVEECLHAGIDESDIISPNVAREFAERYGIVIQGGLWSVFVKNTNRCMLTGSGWIDRHHIFGGSRKHLSEKYGFIAPLRKDLHPNGVYFTLNEQTENIDRDLKEKAFTYYINHYGTEQQFVDEFGKSWL